MLAGHPRTSPVSVVGVDGAKALLLLTPRTSEPERLPAELYLREAADLDLEKEDEIVAFVAEYGAMLDPGYALLDLVSPKEMAAPSPALVAHRRQVELAITRAVKAGTVPPGTAWMERSIIHLDELVLRLQVLRDMTNVWDSLTGSLELDEVRQRWASRLDDPPASPAEAMSFLARRLSAALVPLHPQIVPVEQANVAPLYTALCMQLYDHITRRQTFRRCPECGQRFVSHRGTATQGQYHNKGIVYCSKRCTDVAANRRYRRRQRAKALRGEGLSIPAIAEMMGAETSEVKEWLAGGRRKAK